MTKLPDNRYTVDREFCGYETARFVPRFCGEWLKDSTIWPFRARGQAPAFEKEQDAIAACVKYEANRQSLIAELTERMSPNPQTKESLKP